MDGNTDVRTVFNLAETAAKTIRHIKEIKNAPQEKKQLLKALIQAKGALFTINDLTEAVEDEDWSRTIQSLSPVGGPLSQFQDILEIITSRLNVDDQSSWTDRAVTRLQWPFNRQEIEEMNIRLEQLKTAFHFAIESDHLRLSMDIQKKVGQVSHQVESVQSTLFTNLVSLSSKHAAIVNSLSTVSLSLKLTEARVMEWRITSEWFFEHDAFKSWESGDPSCNTLALVGDAAVGKTVLCEVTKFYLDIWLEGNAKSCAIHLQLYLHDQHHRTRSAIVSTIISKILQTRPHLLRHFLALRPKGGVLPFDVGIHLLQRLRADLDQLYIILDGLNNADDVEMCALLECLLLIQPPVALLVASRPRKYLEQKIAEHIDPRSHMLKETLVTYIQSKIRDSPHFMQHLGYDDKQVLNAADAIAAESEGFFLYAESKMTYLSTIENTSVFEDWLYNNKKASWYDNNKTALINLSLELTLGGILQQAPKRAALAVKLFKMLLNLRQNPDLSETRHYLAEEIAAVALSEDCSTNPSTSELVYILKLCCRDFVLVDRESQCVRFYHSLVEEFLAERAFQLDPGFHSQRKEVHSRNLE